jgi:predicted LPLAT superfamily acyltransferase
MAERIVIPRRARAAALDALIASYAARLEHYARLAPMNWFNFYDFWQQDPSASANAGDLGQHAGT